MLMRNLFYRLFLVINIVIAGVVYTAPACAAPADSIISISRGVMERLIGSRAQHIQLQVIPAPQQHDVYEISAHKGQLLVRGSSL